MYKHYEAKIDVKQHKLRIGNSEITLGHKTLQHW